MASSSGTQLPHVVSQQVITQQILWHRAPHLFPGNSSKKRHRKWITISSPITSYHSSHPPSIDIPAISLEDRDPRLQGILTKMEQEVELRTFRAVEKIRKELEAKHEQDMAWVREDAKSQAVRYEKKVESWKTQVRDWKGQLDKMEDRYERERLEWQDERARLNKLTAMKGSSLQCGSG